MTVLFVLLPLASGIALLYAGLHWRRPAPTVRAILVLGLLNGVSIMTLHPWTDLNHWLWASTPAMLLVAFLRRRRTVRAARRLGDSDHRPRSAHGRERAAEQRQR
jgi:hypothetical protein